jgi:hypothetical protein
VQGRQQDITRFDTKAAALGLVAGAPAAIANSVLDARASRNTPAAAPPAAPPAAPDAAPAAAPTAAPAAAPTAAPAAAPVDAARARLLAIRDRVAKEDSITANAAAAPGQLELLTPLTRTAQVALAGRAGQGNQRLDAPPPQVGSSGAPPQQLPLDGVLDLNLGQLLPPIPAAELESLVRRQNAADRGEIPTGVDPGLAPPQQLELPASSQSYLTVSNALSGAVVLPKLSPVDAQTALQVYVAELEYLLSPGDNAVREALKANPREVMIENIDRLSNLPPKLQRDSPVEFARLQNVRENLKNILSGVLNLPPSTLIASTDVVDTGGTVDVAPTKKPDLVTPTESLTVSNAPPSQPLAEPKNLSDAPPSLLRPKDTSDKGADPSPQTIAAFTAVSEQLDGVIGRTESSQTTLSDVSTVLSASAVSQDPRVKRILAASDELSRRLTAAGVDPAVVLRDTPDAEGTFRPQSNEVSINPTQNGVDKAITLLHELTHRLTTERLIAPTTPAERAARDTVTAVMSALAQKDPNDFRLQNVVEFLAEIKSDPTFAAKVEATALPINRDAPTLTRIADAIKRMFYDSPQFGGLLDANVDALYSADQGDASTAAERVTKYFNQQEADAARRGGQSGELLNRAAQQIAANGVVLEVKRLAATPSISALNEATRPIIDGALNMAIRGLTTLTGGARIIDNGERGILGGTSRPVIRTLEMMHGDRQTEISNDNRAVSAIGDFDVAGQQRILSLAAKLNLVNSGGGYDPRKDPKSAEETALQVEYRSLPSSERAAMNTTQRRLEARNNQLWDAVLTTFPNLDTDTIARLNAVRDKQSRKVAFYFPLTRSGAYSLSTENGDGQTTGFWQSNSFAEIQEIRTQLLAQVKDGDRVSAVRRTRDAPTTQNLKSTGVGGAFALADQIRGNQDIPLAARELVADMILEEQARQSTDQLGKYRIARKGIAGGEVTLAGIMSNAQAMTAAITGLTYAPKIQQTLNDMDAYTRAVEYDVADVTRANTWAGIVRRHAELAVNPIQADGVARNILSVGHMIAMAATPAVAPIQLLSLLTNSVPFLNAALKGFGVRATSDIASAMKDTYTNPGWVAQKRNGDSGGLEGRDKELYDLRKFMQSGAGRLHDDALRSTVEDLAGSPLVAKLKDYGAWFQNKADALAVGATAIAAYDVSKRVNPDFTQDEHHEWVRDAVNYSQPSNAQYDKPVWAKEGSFGKVAYMLRTYPIAVVNGMVADVKDIATLKGAERDAAISRFIGQHTMMVALGGAAATPITYGVVAAIAALGKAGDDDPLKEKLNGEQYLSAYIRENLGEDASRAFDGGIIPGVALGGSVRISPLIVFRTPEDLFSAEGVKDLAFQLTGPIGSSVARGASTEPHASAFDSAAAYAPRALQGPMAAVKLMENNMKALSRNGDIITEVTPADVFFRFMGLQSRAIQEAGADVRILGRLQREGKQDQLFVTRTAAIAREAGAVAEADSIIADHNALYAKYPSFQIKETAVARAQERINEVNTNERDRFTRFERNSPDFLRAIGRTPP